MGWLILHGVLAALLLAVATLVVRRADLRRMAATVGERERAKAHGSHAARLQHPWVDLTRCIGCGTCVDACPEHGVLELVHGQAAVVHGARCVGHGLCARACPTGAIALTLADVHDRRDLPAVTEGLEVKGSPGLFLAGEVTGYALVRTAIAHGTAVAREVAQRPAPAAAPRPLQRARADAGGGVATMVAETEPRTATEVLDLCIVGAGPAGIACALAARERDLSFVVLEQDQLGGTVAKYPRRKLVMTQPVELPLHGRLKRTSYSKEELMQLWQDIVAEHDLPLRTGAELVGLERGGDGVYTVRCRDLPEVRARHVCLCLGRRGTPRRLGVPGEDLPKVAYSLLDAQSFQNRRIVVVGGGDSAVEAAMGLAEQPGNQVTLSYRRGALSRVKARNQERFDAEVGAGRLRVLWHSEVQEITDDAVVLAVGGEDGAPRRVRLANDEVFVFAGGTPPFALLEQCGVSFDPAARDPVAPLAEQGTGLLRALLAALGLAGLAVVWTLVFRDYYALPTVQRPDSELHDALRPSSPLGVALGVAATLLIACNLLYLLRRSRLGRWIAGSLRNWLSLHVVSGVLAMLLALVHAALEPRPTLGGHAFLCLVVLVITGAIGRYFYSYVPKAANGREMLREELEGRLAAISGEWDAEKGGFGDAVRAEVHRLVARSHWQRSFAQRLGGLLADAIALRRALRRLAAEGRAQGIPQRQVQRILMLARRTHRAAQAASHYEDLRGLLASWRYFHRWVALLMVALVALHIATAVRWGGLR